MWHHLNRAIANWWEECQRNCKLCFKLTVAALSRSQHGNAFILGWAQQEKKPCHVITAPSCL